MYNATPKVLGTTGSSAANPAIAQCLASAWIVVSKPTTLGVFAVKGGHVSAFGGIQIYHAMRMITERCLFSTLVEWKE